ncbi:endonuclease NucS [Halapricum hydrolyticum]|uniref:Endonuclease NucS n=1 Tax=Halapricum hydrolyticum TaxID=2979991 RepID=A0AAE3I9S1_9EURY|nr:endonuclease NucS [Halapricum hydrolyticum]MCU4717125.1 endonuclease NucS [Halapricum hydrolyticum]MCU4726052.1 endonuclease NucS [Halapricum hydrolyticum]
MTSDVRARTDPSIETARSIVETGLEGGAVVTVFGECTVEYDGRAASTLGPGDRHVMCKPDGTVLVHTDEGHQPVNWQPPGCTHEVVVAEDTFTLESRRDNPDEFLAVTFESVGHVAAFDVTDPEELSLSGTEEDLRQRILENPSLIEPGFTPLATERETPAGAVDVYGEDDDGQAVVLELKRRRVGPDAVGQLARYVEALQRDLHAETGVRGILVAPSVTDRARSLLAERGLEFVALEP